MMTNFPPNSEKIMQLDSDNKTDIKSILDICNSECPPNMRLNALNKLHNVSKVDRQLVFDSCVKICTEKESDDILFSLFGLFSVICSDCIIYDLSRQIAVLRCVCRKGNVQLEKKIFSFLDSILLDHLHIVHRHWFELVDICKEASSSRPFLTRLVGHSRKFLRNSLECEIRSFIPFSHKLFTSLKELSTFALEQKYFGLLRNLIRVCDYTNLDCLRKEIWKHKCKFFFDLIKNKSFDDQVRSLLSESLCHCASCSELKIWKELVTRFHAEMLPYFKTFKVLPAIDPLFWQICELYLSDIDDSDVWRSFIMEIYPKSFGLTPGHCILASEILTKVPLQSLPPRVVLVVQSFMTDLVNDSNEKLRFNGFRVMGLFDFSDPNFREDCLLSISESASCPTVTVKSTWALANITEAHKVEPCIFHLFLKCNEKSKVNVLRACGNVLRHVFDQRLFDFVIKHISSGQFKTRWNSANALRHALENKDCQKLLDEKIVNELVQCLHCKNFKVRIQVCKVLIFVSTFRHVSGIGSMNVLLENAQTDSECNISYSETLINHLEQLKISISQIPANSISGM